MTTTTRKYEDKDKIIEVSLEREVNDKVDYADGYNIPMGRETYEIYRINLTNKTTGATIKTFGHPGEFGFCDLVSPTSTYAPKGAYAKIGSAYISKDVYDIVMRLLDEVERAIPEDKEYAAIKSGEAAREAAYYKAVDGDEEKHASQIANGLCPICGTYCDGDCQSN